MIDFEEPKPAPAAPDEPKRTTEELLKIALIEKHFGGPVDAGMLKILMTDGQVEQKDGRPVLLFPDEKGHTRLNADFDPMTPSDYVHALTGVRPGSVTPSGAPQQGPDPRTFAFWGPKECESFKQAHGGGAAGERAFVNLAQRIMRGEIEQLPRR